MESILGNELDHWSKLQGQRIKKKPLEKRLSDLKKVILDPDTVSYTHLTLPTTPYV